MLSLYTPYYLSPTTVLTYLPRQKTKLESSELASNLDTAVAGDVGQGCTALRHEEFR